MVFREGRHRHNTDGTWELNQKQFDTKINLSNQKNSDLNLQCNDVKKAAHGGIGFVSLLCLSLNKAVDSPILK